MNKSSEESNQLESAQKEIEELIKNFAKKNGLSTPTLEPIYDGIADADAYLSARKKILWILKEPYDDIGSNDKPEGGGWSIPANFIQNPDVCAKTMTNQVIIYASYGILHNIKSYNDMDYISDNNEMIKTLTQIAYMNISKMPNRTVSVDKQINNFYTIWKEILFKQINTYKPDIIIFGNTFKYFEKDLFPSGTPAHKTYSFSNTDYIYSYKWNNTLLMNAYHPNAHKKHNEYVDAILQCAREES